MYVCSAPGFGVGVRVVILICDKSREDVAYEANKRSSLRGKSLRYNMGLTLVTIGLNRLSKEPHE